MFTFNADNAAHLTTGAARVAAVANLGSSADYASDIAAAVFVTAPAETDWSAHGAVGGAIVAWTGSDEAQTEDDPSGAKGKNGKAKRVRTTFGKGVDAVASHLRSIVADLNKPADEEPEDQDEDQGEDETPADTAPDYLALAVQAATTALANGVDVRDLFAALEAATAESAAA